MTAVNYMPEYLIREQDDLSVLPETFGDKLIVHLTLHPENTAYWTLADALLADIQGSDGTTVHQEEHTSYQRHNDQAYNQQDLDRYNRETDEKRIGDRGTEDRHSLDRQYLKNQAEMYPATSPSYRPTVYSSTITISKSIKDGYDSEDSSPFLDIFNDDRQQKSSYASRQNSQQYRSPGLDRYQYSEMEGSDVSAESTLNRSGGPLSKASSPGNTLKRSDVSMTQLNVPSGPPLLVTVHREEQTSYESSGRDPAGHQGLGSDDDVMYPSNAARSTASRDLDDLMTNIKEFDASVGPRNRAGQGENDRAGGRGVDDIDSMPRLNLTSTTGSASYYGPGTGDADRLGPGGAMGPGGIMGTGGVNGNGSSGLRGEDNGGQPVPGTQVFNAAQVIHSSVVKPGDGGEHALHGKAGSQGGSEGMLIRLDGDASDNGMLRIPRGDCAACAQPVSGQVLLALNNIYHPEHFTCAHCRQQLGTNVFYEHSGQPFCEHDYQMLFSPKCAGCNGAILEKCISALNQSWHPEHFLCAACGKQFGDEGFHEKDGLAYCSEDYFGMFAPKCGGCEHAILDNYISALHKQWHPDCFVCQECGAPFETGSFYDHEGLPYCEKHFHARRGSLCDACNKPITGKCVAAMYKKYHPEHFVCCFCLHPLNKGTFKEQKEKPYCHTCFDKLFG